MFPSATRFRPAYAVFFALALSVAACSGASSDDAKKGDAAAAEDTGYGEGALADMSEGDPNAPVTIIEYASVTCPHCAAFYEDVYPAIKEKYIDTGKVRFVFREFPTPPADLSVVGSMVARCAVDKGGKKAYFLVLSALFSSQKTWIMTDNPRAELLKIASQAGMDEKAFDACVRREEVLDVINKNIDSGRDQYNVNSTPSFILNGQLRHFSTVEEFSKALDEALEKSGKGEK